MTMDGHASDLTDWDKIERLSQELLELANEEKWDEFQKVEQKRKNCLNKFFIKEIPLEHAQNIVAGISRVKELDKQLTVLVQESRDYARRELMAISKSRRVQKAYNDNKQ